jgi:hypothetical protein
MNHSGWFTPMNENDIYPFSTEFCTLYKAPAAILATEFYLFIFPVKDRKNIRQSLNALSGHSYRTDIPGNHNPLNFGCAFADFQQFLIPVKPFHIKLLHQAVTTVKLNRMIGAIVHYFGTVKFGHGRFFGKRQIIVPKPAGFV